MGFWKIDNSREIQNALQMGDASNPIEVEWFDCLISTIKIQYKISS